MLTWMTWVRLYWALTMMDSRQHPFVVVAAAAEYYFVWFSANHFDFSPPSKMMRSMVCRHSSSRHSGPLCVYSSQWDSQSQWVVCAHLMWVRLLSVLDSCHCCRRRCDHFPHRWDRYRRCSDATRSPTERIVLAHGMVWPSQGPTCDRQTRGNDHLDPVIWTTEIDINTCRAQTHSATNEHNEIYLQRQLSGARVRVVDWDDNTWQPLVLVTWRTKGFSLVLSDDRIYQAIWNRVPSRCRANSSSVNCVPLVGHANYFVCAGHCCFRPEVIPISVIYVRAKIRNAHTIHLTLPDWMDPVELHWHPCKRCHSDWNPMDSSFDFDYCPWKCLHNCEMEFNRL